MTNIQIMSYYFSFTIAYIKYMSYICGDIRDNLT